MIQEGKVSAMEESKLYSQIIIMPSIICRRSFTRTNEGSHIWSQGFVMGVQTGPRPNILLAVLCPGPMWLQQNYGPSALANMAHFSISWKRRDNELS